MNKLLTPNEIAEYLGVKPSTIYQWTHQGFIPHIKLGKFVRFKVSEVEKWVSSKSENGRKKLRIDVREFGI